MDDTPHVSSATEAAIAVLTEAGLDYALIGGLAVVLRGHDRLTQDVDALVWGLDDHLDDLTTLLVKHGFRAPTSEELGRALATRLLHTLWNTEVVVDFMLGLVPFEREALDNATLMQLDDGVTARVATPEDLVIMKLIASRAKDISDVIALKKLYPGLDRHRIRLIVADYADALERSDILENVNRLFPDSKG